MGSGPEFTSRAIIEWARRRGIELVWIEPRTPIQNAYAERYNACFRDECVNQHHFTTLDDARTLIEDWRQDYNLVRPHTSLGGHSPERYSELCSEAVASEQILGRQRRLAFPSNFNPLRIQHHS